MLFKSILTFGVVSMLAAMSVGSTMARAAELTVLPNGLTVLIQEDDRFPLVSMRLFVHAGSAYEEPRESGVSHLLEHMVFKGTAKRPPGQVAKEIESAGGYLNAGTSFDQTVYIVDLPHGEWMLGLDVLKDMIFDMALDPEELEQEKKVVLSELERNEDSPGRVLFQSLQPLVWPETGYAKPVIGTRETLAEIAREDIVAYLDRLYVPQGMLLVVCGKVKASEVLREARRLFGDVDNARPFEPASPWDVSQNRPGPVIHVEAGPWKKVHMAVALPVPGMMSGEEPGLEVLAQILGGDKTSRLYRKFKYDLDLVDEISFSALLMERAGALYLSAQLDPDKLEAFWSELVLELYGLTSASFSGEEIERAKLNIEDSLFQAKETLSGLASKIGYFQFYENGGEAEERYLYNLRRVDSKELQDLAKAHLTPSRICASFLLPEEVSLKSELFASKIEELWPAEVVRDVQEVMETATPGAEHIYLGGGHSLALIPDETLPYTAVTMAWPGGDLLLEPGQSGLASLAAKGLPRGLPGMDAPAIREFLADRTARLSVQGGRDQFSLYVKYPVRFEADIQDLLGRMILNPTWPEVEVDRIKQEQLSDIVDQEDQPLGLLFRHAFPFLFKDHPFGHYHLGRPEEVAGYSRDQLSAFWREQRKQPMSIAVCGQFDRERILTWVRSLTGPEAAVSSLEPPRWTQEKEMKLTLADRNQTHLLVVFPAVGLRHDRTAEFSLLKTVLAGQGGLLFRELRDRQGLGYSVTAMLWQSLDTGFLAFYIGTYPDKADQALDSFRSVVEGLQQGILPNDELQRAKNLLQGQYYREHQSLGSRSGEAAELLSYGLPLDYREALIDRAGRLTAQDLVALVKEYFDWDKAYLLQVAP